MKGKDQSVIQNNNGKYIAVGVSDLYFNFVAHFYAYSNDYLSSISRQWSV